MSLNSALSVVQSFSISMIWYGITAFNYTYDWMLKQITNRDNFYYVIGEPSTKWIVDLTFPYIHKRTLNYKTFYRFEDCCHLEWKQIMTVNEDVMYITRDGETRLTIKDYESDLDNLECIMSAMIINTQLGNSERIDVTNDIVFLFNTSNKTVTLNDILPYICEKHRVAYIAPTLEVVDSKCDIHIFKLDDVLTLKTDATNN